MSSEQYDKHKAEALANCVRRAVTTLKEHCESLTITCNLTDSQGVIYTHEAEWSEDDDNEGGEKVDK